MVAGNKSPETSHGFTISKSYETSKKPFPNTVLIAGVPNDQTTHTIKGPTEMKDNDRYKAVRNCQ